MTGNTNAIKPLHHYSTTEQVVGTWIDGRPVYKKTVVKDSNFVINTNTVAHNVQNLDFCISAKGFMIKANDYSRPIGEEINNGSYSAGVDLVDSTNIKLYIGSGIINDNLLDWLFVTIQYTKTTD